MTEKLETTVREGVSIFVRVTLLDIFSKTSGQSVFRYVCHDIGICGYGDRG